MKVLLLSRYGRQGASTRLRALQYLPHLASDGIDVAWAPLLDDAYLEALYGAGRRPWPQVARAYVTRLMRLLRARDFDLLWIEKELFPMLPATLERLLAAAGVGYVVDYDDALFHNYDLHRRALVRRFMGRKIDRVMAGARLVIAGNDYLAARAENAGARWIEHLPTVIDLDRYPARLDAPATHVRPFTIGWIGSPHTADYLAAVAEPLRQLLACGDARLVLIGAGRAAPADLPAEVRPWAEADEVRDIGEFDVGIMPLPDAPWERGKCGYKLIQYMACAKPVVASPVGVNHQLVASGVNGYLATTAGEWQQALAHLRADRALGQRLGEAGRAQIVDRYCLQVTAPRLAALLRRAAGS
ncbi:glycosyltransferase family 4 protein [Candidatus Macondimonas diazotrophica]|jgi:glycosyltransferase involved in cell wall biosynthesis|uniref:Glycosyltransferase n=1 Tax=Candidatus Macondimonas diazotrophica TaxID=2305248 RepID=A0A4Z0F939_9GAMM|nr:glycosyltransferase family 4 protein [Candidatus Macondimonas diazotrophica]NCU00811.1 glycosyltransferase family 4 protein [Candidatus Macondimonas diazotrophica]TFZ82587.1 glycosyltransferase [Candidatus Macondimonas diazotrophica]HBG29101.1 glycosyl transferase family 1 [Gammaproteobacteria bacterium]